MIVTFGDKDTEQLYITGKSRRYSSALCKVGLRKLDYLHAASSLQDLRVPSGNCLEALKGDYKGFYSIRINDQFRIIFKFANSGAYDVRIDDYH